MIKELQKRLKEQNIKFYYVPTDDDHQSEIVGEHDQFRKYREFDSCLQFFTNQIAQNVDYINAFEFFYCQICENNCTNMG